MSSQCIECGARCCRYFCFQLDTPDSYEEFENIRWYLCHRGVSVHVDEGDWYISIENQCNWLDEKTQRCTNYDQRPLICRKYAVGNCDHTQGSYEYEQLFTQPEQVEAYGRRKLGKRRWELEKAAAMAELAPAPQVGPIDVGQLMGKGKSAPAPKGSKSKGKS